jgi:hypothetical protein
VKLTIEPILNGYLVREDEDPPWAITGGDEAESARLMLWEVNERVGHLGSRHDERRVRIITMPGDDWLPAEPGGCSHPWTLPISSGASVAWRCPCGAEFALAKPGGSWAEELRLGGTGEVSPC